MTSGDNEHGRRREQRQGVDLAAIAFRRDGSRSVVAITDISYEGCQVDGGPAFTPTERIRLAIPCRGEIGARVRWASKGKTGTSFDSSSGALVPPSDRRALKLARSFNYGSGRVFGRRGLRKSEKAA